MDYFGQSVYPIYCEQEYARCEELEESRQVQATNSAYTLLIYKQL